VIEGSTPCGLATRGDAVGCGSCQSVLSICAPEHGAAKPGIADRSLRGRVTALASAATSGGPKKKQPSPVERRRGTVVSNQSQTREADMADAPIGSIVAWSGPQIPNGWRECNGDPLDRNAFQALFSVIGTTWGGDAVNLFRLPDLRGMFLRGVSGTSKRDPDADSRLPASPGDPNQGNRGNAVGSQQGDALQNHAHTTPLNDARNWPTSGTMPTPVPTFEMHPGQQQMRTGDALSASIASETRPENAYVYWIIRVA
jgi:microcystin-dependent protein